MAMKGILRPGLIQLRVMDLDAAITHYVDRLGMQEVTRGSDGRVYLKAYDEFDHHSLILRPADRAGMDYFAFKVDTDESLSEFDRRVRGWPFLCRPGRDSSAGLDTINMSNRH